jgi:hypothetical protein
MAENRIYLRYDVSRIVSRYDLPIRRDTMFLADVAEITAAQRFPAVSYRRIAPRASNP